MSINFFTPLPRINNKYDLKRFREVLRVTKQKMTSTLPHPLFCALKAVLVNLTGINKLNYPALFISFISPLVIKHAGKN